MDKNIDFFINKASWLRRQVLEKLILTQGKGHIGSTYSCVELLIALYYSGILNIDANNPKWEDRDRLIIGKGHVCYAVYCILADLGFFDKQLLKEYGMNGGFFGVQMNINTPGIEYNTGSLGNAIGIGSGIALSAKLNNKKFKTFVLVGDGECQEGSIWESLIFASQNKLNNLVGIIDRNHLGVTDFIQDNACSKLEQRVTDCGWSCITIDGHSFQSIFDAFTHIDNNDKPFMIIADTIKGKGISFMENNKKWHNAALSPEEIIIAMKETI